MSAPPIVSVIVPVFNAEATLPDTLRSIVAQTYPHLEIIVVDDGSRDGSVGLVEMYASRDPRIRLIRQANRGVADARNRAIAEARGVYIAPIDADDVWAPTKIARQLQRFDECDPRTGFVYSWWVSIDAEGVILDRSPSWRVEGRALESLVEVNFSGNASVPLFRRAAIEEAGGYNASLRANCAQGCEDWELAIRVAERHPVAVVPEVLVAYRRQAGAMSTQCQTMWRSHALLLEGLVRRQVIGDRAVLRVSRGQFALHLSGVAFFAGRPLSAVRWALRAWPPWLVLAVSPYLVRVLARRLTSKAGRSRAAIDVGRFDTTNLPEPQVAYDRIYAARWERRAERQTHAEVAC